MSEYYKNLSQISQAIINEPQKNIDRLQELLKKNDEVALLCLLKIFVNIIPLYKIKIIEDQIKHKKEYIKLQNYDKALYKYYKIYVTNICKLKTALSYKIAVNLLLKLDHFNFAEKIISKVVKGCLENHKICIDAIISKIKNDTDGNSTMKIMIELMDFSFGDKVYECITNINILNEIKEEELEKIEETKTERKRKRKLKNNKYGKDIEKTSLLSKTDKKINKEMKSLQNKYRTKDKEELDNIRNKMILKIVDCAMRIMFMILKQKKESLYTYTFEGLMKYKRFIRKEFDEGLMIMLSEVIMNNSKEHKIYGSLCILDLYGDKDFEFRQVLNAVYDLLTPLKYNFTQNEKQEIYKIVDTMFLCKKQLKKDAQIFLQRLMQFCLLNVCYELQKLISRIVLLYKIDKYDLDVVCDGLYDPCESETKIVAMQPLYVSYTFDFLYGNK
ncbi:Nucleolar complex protein 3 [Binucleata daphniae]